MGQLRTLFHEPAKEEVRVETEQAIAEFLAKGGSITQVKSKKSKTKLTANGKNSGNVFVSVYQ